MNLIIIQSMEWQCHSQEGTELIVSKRAPSASPEYSSNVLKSLIDPGVDIQRNHHNSLSGLRPRDLFGATMVNETKKRSDPMSKGQTLQEPFLNTLRKERVPVSIYLVNGIKLQGQIDSFDQFVVLLRNSVSQMVYKHAISTIVPSRAVRIPYNEEIAE